MRPSLWQRAKALLEEALQKPASEREAFVHETAQDDEVLSLVLQLLESHEHLDDFLAPPALSEVGTSDTDRDFGRFRLEGVLGRGGGSVVHRAVETATGRAFALKILSPAAALTPLARGRLQREAESASRLSHEGIIRVHEIGEEAGLPYILMDYVDGKTLSDEIRRLREAPSSEGILPSPETEEYARVVAELIQRVTEAVTHAHNARLVHRDIKPQNIIIDNERRPYLLDLGLVKDLHEPTLSATGDLEGTPNYMSPEQIRSHMTVDHRTDIYSTGVVLYELLTLKRPFDAATQSEVLKKILREEPPSAKAVNPNVPTDLNTICMCALEKRPEDRYDSAMLLAEDLQRFLSLKAIKARPVSPLGRFSRSLRRYRLGIGVAIATLIAFASIGFLAVALERARERDSLQTSLREFLGSETGELGSKDKFLIDRCHRFLESGHADAEISELIRDSVSRFETEKARLRTIADGIARELLGDSARDSLAESPDFLRIGDFTAAKNAYDAYAGESDETLESLLLRLTRVDVTVSCRTDDLETKYGVYLQRLDPATLRTVGAAPTLLADSVDPRENYGFQIPTGVYLITVVQRERFSEIIRYWEGDAAPRQARVIAWARDGLPEECSLVAANTIGVEIFTDAAEVVQYELEPFWVSTATATNGSYREFLRSNALRSDFFEDLAGDLDRLPVTMVNRDQAQLFAEWLGMRLPLLAEWELAVRGPNSALLPEGAVAEEFLPGCNLGRRSYQSQPELWRQLDGLQNWFIDNLAPAASGSRSGHGGIYHAVGNVWERTLNPGCKKVRGSVKPDIETSYVAGFSCEDRIDFVRERGLNFRLITHAMEPQYNVGFRCVKSLKPLAWK